MFGCCGCANKKPIKDKNLDKTIELTSDEKKQEEKEQDEDVKENDKKEEEKEKDEDHKQQEKNVTDGKITKDEKKKIVRIVSEIETKEDINVNKNRDEKKIDIKETIKIDDDGLGKETDVEFINDNGIVVENNELIKNRLQSDTSNITLEETIQINQLNNEKLLDQETTLTLLSDIESNNLLNNCDDTLINSKYNNNRTTHNSISSTITFTNENDEKKLESCLTRRSSSKSSMKKKVNYNDNSEIIPQQQQQSSDLTSITDDDEVFSDSIPSKLPRGDMCTPYPLKRGSMPGLVALPDWFNSEDREIGGILEPPATPVGRDELALKRHRFFSELLTAAQAASEHRVRFDPLGPIIAASGCHHYDDDCDPNLRPSTSSDLEHLVNRLERIIDRLERTVSARELEFANQVLLNHQQQQQQQQLQTAAVTSTSIATQSIIDNYTNDLLLSPQLPSPPSEIYQNLTDKLEERIIVLEKNFNNIEKLEENFIVIPTVVQQLEYQNTTNNSDTKIIENEITINNMSVNGYQDITSGPLADFLKLSNKIGGDVATQCEFVKKAFDAQLKYVTLATQLAKPPQNKQDELLKPTSDQITAIQNFREKNRTSPYFNHLSAISESIPALGWVCVAPTPGPHVKEMNDAGQFYTNRVLKDWKEKDMTHVEWARSWIQTLNELQKFIKQYHTTGLVWSGKGQAPMGGGCPPPPPPGMPPPPPIIPLDDLSLDGGHDRSALFSEINKGADITKNLKKVTSDMQTHKNSTLRTGPAPFVTPQPYKPTTAPKPGAVTAADMKAPVFTRDGKKWLIEYQKSNRELKIENAEMNNVVYMFKCQDSTLTVTGKINSIVIDSCKKCSVLFESLVSSVEFVNCQSVQMQVLGKVPTISIDKTDGCQMYLSDKSLDVEIVSSKSSEMNVMMPLGDGDFSELPIPEQFKTTIKGKTLNTTFVESLG